MGLAVSFELETYCESSISDRRYTESLDRVGLVGCIKCLKKAWTSDSVIVCNRVASFSTIMFAQKSG